MSWLWILLPIGALVAVCLTTTLGLSLLQGVVFGFLLGLPVGALAAHLDNR